MGIRQHLQPHGKLRITYLRKEDETPRNDTLAVDYHIIYIVTVSIK